MDVIVLSDSDEDHKPFGQQTKKRKIDSDSEDEYEPPLGKRQKKIKMGTKSGTCKKDKKLPADSKERKPKTVTKRTVMKNKALKTENKNEVCICVCLAGLNVWIQVLGYSDVVWCIFTDVLEWLSGAIFRMVFVLPLRWRQQAAPKCQ